MELDFSFMKKLNTLPSIEKALGKKAIARLQAHLDKRKPEMVKHFKNDGWDIDFSTLMSDAVAALIGGNIFPHIAAQFMSRGVKLVIVNGKWLLVKESGKKAPKKKAKAK